MNIVLFLKVIAWIGISYSTLFIASSFHTEKNYTPLHRSLDRMRGVTVTFPRGKYWLIWIVSLAFIISSW